MNGYNLIKKKPVLWLTMVAVLMAMNVVLSSFSIPVPGGHLYLNDIVICTAAILLDPLGAFIVGGVGAFLGDFFFYPAPMFVDLALVLKSTLKARADKVYGNDKLQPVITALGAGIGVVLGAIIMVIGYTLGRAFVYSTPEYAIIKLPFEILQAGIGAVMGMVLCFSRNLAQRFEKICA